MVEDTWSIEGGIPLYGTICPSGSKNGALPTLAATLLLDGETILENVPEIADAQTMQELLCALGLTVENLSDNRVRVVNRGLSNCCAPESLVRKMRASHYLLGPLLLRLGKAEMAMPGGCDLGARPVTHIISVLEMLGAEVVTNETIMLRANGLCGTVVTLDPQHRNPGATFTALMAASLAQGETVIENASYEPDVTNFCQFLTAAGARIEGIGKSRLVVQGVERLVGAHHRINPDRLEAGTFICAAAATRGEVLVQDITWGELGETLDKLVEAGVEIKARDGGLLAGCPQRPCGVEITTDPFPAFSTDLQPPVGAVLATARGNSTIAETVFDHRLQYVDELAKMGADIELPDSRHAVIHGVERLHGAEVAGGNIRDGAALVIAALGAEGKSVVSGKHYIARGYESFEKKLRLLGARITGLRQ